MDFEIQRRGLRGRSAGASEAGTAVDEVGAALLWYKAISCSLFSKPHF